MLSRSISATEAAPTPTARARRRISGASASRCDGESVFESRTPQICRQWGRRITAAATTGPQVGATPTSSTPATRRTPAFQSRRSRRSVGTGGAIYGQRSRAVAPPCGSIRLRRAGPDQRGQRAVRAGPRSARAALAQRCGLADPASQEIELCAAGHAVADHLDLLDPGAVDLERPLDAHAGRDPPDGQRPRDPAARQAEDGPLEYLDALPSPLDNLGADLDGIAGREGRDVRSNLVLDDLVEYVHRVDPCCTGRPGWSREPRSWAWLTGRGWAADGGV